MSQNKQIKLVKASYNKLTKHPQAFRDSRKALVIKIWNHGKPKWDSMKLNNQPIQVDVIQNKRYVKKSIR